MTFLHKDTFIFYFNKINPITNIKHIWQNLSSRFFNNKTVEVNNFNNQMKQQQLQDREFTVKQQNNASRIINICSHELGFLEAVTENTLCHLNIKPTEEESKVFLTRQTLPKLLALREQLTVRHQQFNTNTNDSMSVQNYTLVKKNTDDVHIRYEACLNTLNSLIQNITAVSLEETEAIQEQCLEQERHELLNTKQKLEELKEKYDQSQKFSQKLSLRIIQKDKNNEELDIEYKKLKRQLEDINIQIIADRQKYVEELKEKDAKYLKQLQDILHMQKETADSQELHAANIKLRETIAKITCDHQTQHTEMLTELRTTIENNNTLLMSNKNYMNTAKNITDENKKLKEDLANMLEESKSKTNLVKEYKKSSEDITEKYNNLRRVVGTDSNNLHQTFDSFNLCLRNITPECEAIVEKARKLKEYPSQLQTTRERFTALTKEYSASVANVINVSQKLGEARQLNKNNSETATTELIQSLTNQLTKAEQQEEQANRGLKILTKTLHELETTYVSSQQSYYKETSEIITKLNESLKKSFKLNNELVESNFNADDYIRIKNQAVHILNQKQLAQSSSLPLHQPASFKPRDNNYIQMALKSELTLRSTSMHTTQDISKPINSLENSGSDTDTL